MLIYSLLNNIKCKTSVNIFTLGDLFLTKMVQINLRITALITLRAQGQRRCIWIFLIVDEQSLLHLQSNYRVSLKLDFIRSCTVKTTWSNKKHELVFMKHYLDQRNLIGKRTKVQKYDNINLQILEFWSLGTNITCEYIIRILYSNFSWY